MIKKQKSGSANKIKNLSKAALLLYWTSTSRVILVDMLMSSSWISIWESLCSYSLYSTYTVDIHMYLYMVLVYVNGDR